MSRGPRGGRPSFSLIPVMALLFGAFALWIVASSLIPGLLLRADQEREITDVNRQLAAIQQENRTLKEEVARLSDPDYLEVVARSKYNLAKPGEHLYNVIDVPPPAEEPTASAEPSGPAGTPWWRRALDWLPGA